MTCNKEATDRGELNCPVADRITLADTLAEITADEVAIIENLEIIFSAVFGENEPPKFETEFSSFVHELNSARVKSSMIRSGIESLRERMFK